MEEGASSSNPLDVIPNEIPFDVPYGLPITLDRAEAVIHAAVAEARRRNWKMNVAIADSGGNLVAFERMESAMRVVRSQLLVSREVLREKYFERSILQKQGLLRRGWVNDGHDARNSIGGEVTKACMLPDVLIVRRDVNAIELVFRYITL